MEIPLNVGIFIPKSGCSLDRRGGVLAIVFIPERVSPSHLACRVGCYQTQMGTDRRFNGAAIFIPFRVGDDLLSNLYLSFPFKSLELCEFAWELMFSDPPERV